MDSIRRGCPNRIVRVATNLEETGRPVTGFLCGFWGPHRVTELELVSPSHASPVQSSCKEEPLCPPPLSCQSYAFHKDKLRGKKYFTELMKSLEEVPEPVKEKDFGETNEKYPMNEVEVTPPRNQVCE